MTIFLQRDEQSYAERPNPYSVNATIPAGKTINRVKVTLTRPLGRFTDPQGPNPNGPAGEVVLTYPDGSTSGFSFDGGDLLKRDGSPLTETVCQFEKFAIVNDVQVPIPFNVGSYTLALKVLQTLTTAATVEWF